MADITVDGSVSSTNTSRAMRSVVFTSSSVGYFFFIDGDNDYKYAKTTDGGQTWSGLTTVYTGTAIAADIWFDKWTPGGTGTVVHLWYVETDNSDVRYRAFNTTSDSLGTEVVVFNGASAVAGRGVFVSGAKARGGNLLCAFDMDAGAETGTYRSTDAGANWGVRSNLVEATVDQLFMFPGNETDNQDMWALYQDASTNELTLKMHDDSADSNSESSALTMAEQVTDATGQYGFAGSIRHSDGHLIAAFWNIFDSATGDFLVYDINGTSSLTAKTNIVTDNDDCYHPSVYIDQGTDAIYVAYNGKRDGSESIISTSIIYYTKSTDGGATWSAGDTAYGVGSTNNRQTWTPLMGPRFYVGWRGGASALVLLANYDNSLPIGIAFDAASNSGYQSPSSGYSWSHTCSGNQRFLAVDVEILSIPGTTVSGVTYNSVALSFIGAKSTVSGAGRVESWGLATPTSGSNTIAVTLSASVASAGTAVSYTGVQQASPTEAYASAQATNVGAADATVNSVSVTDDCWFHAACATDDAAITASQTTRNNVTGALGSGANEDTGPKATADSQTMSYTGVGALATWCIGAYAIRPVYAAGAASGAMVGTTSLAFSAGSSALLGAGALTGAIANIFGAGSSTLLGSGALLGVGALSFAAGSSVMQGGSSGVLLGSSDLTFAAGSSVMKGAGALAGVAANVFGAGSSTMVGAGALLGTSSNSFGAGSSTLLGSGTLLGISSNTFGAGSSTLVGAGLLTGSSSLTITVSSTILGAGTLVGTSINTFEPSSTLVGAGNLAGLSAVTLTPAASLDGSGALLGSSYLTFGAGGSTVSGAGVLAGASDLTLSGSSTLLGAGTLSGSSNLTITPTGSGQSIGLLSGAIALVLSVSAEIIDSAVYARLAEGVLYVYPRASGAWMLDDPRANAVFIVSARASGVLDNSPRSLGSITTRPRDSGVLT